MKRVSTLLAVLLCTATTIFADLPFRNYRYDAFKPLPVTSDNIVFIGNSITNMHEWWEAFGNHNVVNRGVSASVYADGGIAIGFEVNNEAIDEYTKITGKTVKFGVFAVLESQIGTNDIFDEEGKAQDGVICAELTKTKFSMFEIKISGMSISLLY